MNISRRQFSLTAVLLVAFLCGCKPVAAPLPAGAVKTVDAQINAILQAGHAAVVQYDADVKAGFAPTAAYQTIMTNLMEARFLVGDEGLFERMRAATGPDRVWDSQSFFAAKR